MQEAGFIAEEDTEAERAEEYNWVIDPLDGTTNFMHGLRMYCVSIALLKKNEPILGVVYEINNDECFYAIKGGKAFLNRKPISISKVTEFQDGLYITGMPYTNFERLDDYFKIFEHFTRHTHGIRRLGSAAADIAYVACGRSEGFFEFGLHPWDVAAAALILKEAGGMVTDYSGGDNYIFGGEMIAGCAVQPQMVEIIQSYWFK
jgi:myo-inositol-1(or 4)-monophosphatase